MNADALTATYEDMEPDLIRLAEWAAYRYRLNYDEAFAEASRQFWLAYNNHDPAKMADFPKFMRFRVRRGLISHVRSIAQAAARFPKDADFAIEDVAECRAAMSFDFQDFAADLSTDARIAARLAVQMPAELWRAIVDKGGEDQNYRSSLRQYLQYKLGWSAARIRDAFDEVRAAL
jgi:hypothetical protein